MSASPKIGGIWAAVLTPIHDEPVPDPRVALPYHRELLNSGCDGLNVLGTTGEAMSFSADQRRRYMENLASSDLPMDRVMVGTGAAALADAVHLTRTAAECGFVAALVMPPFFFREASDDGILAFFDALLSRAKLPKNGIFLYNFPRMSGITFHPELVDRLIEAFPGTIAGVKDSSNDPNLQHELLARHPDLRVLPGSEGDLLGAKARGVAGCISGSVALWPNLAQTVFSTGDKAQARELARRRESLDGLPFIPAVRFLTARARNEPEWERIMPPQRPLSPEQRETLERAFPV